MEEIQQPNTQQGNPENPSHVVVELFSYSATILIFTYAFAYAVTFISHDISDYFLRVEAHISGANVWLVINLLAHQLLLGGITSLGLSLSTLFVVKTSTSKRIFTLAIYCLMFGVCFYLGPLIDSLPNPCTIEN